MSGFYARGRSVEVAATLLHNGANIKARFLFIIMIIIIVICEYDNYQHHHYDDDDDHDDHEPKLGRTAWGDSAAHYAARHGTVCMLRFLNISIIFK